jgi:hypothetical protein
MSETPETQEAVERWQQGKINIFDEMARLERERNEAIASSNERGVVVSQVSGALVDAGCAVGDAREFGDLVKKLAAERDQYRRHLELITEDCEAWLNSESDEPSVDFIKAVRDYAKKGLDA